MSKLQPRSSSLSNVDAFIASLFAQLPLAELGSSGGRVWMPDTRQICVIATNATNVAYAVQSDCDLLFFQSEASAFLSRSNDTFINQNVNGVAGQIIAMSNGNAVMTLCRSRLKAGEIIYFVPSSNTKMLAVVTQTIDITN